MKAELVVRRRIAFGARDFVEMVVWRVSEPVPPTIHGYKYRLVYIVEGRRVVGFDNERGKGDHRHIDGIEDPYVFEGVDRLLSDFIGSVRQWRADHDRA